MTPAALIAQLRSVAEITGAHRHIVAFSGGRDSTVLLDLARRALPRIDGAALLAVHIDHCWHAQSADWASRCAVTARSLGVRFAQCTVNGVAAAGESPEAAARAARYSALADFMEPHDVLWTAHHADDQMETVLLQLLRGAGVAGLAAMPTLTSFGPGLHWRPLLDTPAAALAYYARQNEMQWLDDPANRNERFDRSFLRKNVIPALQQRWPGGARSVARSARHCADAAELLKELGERDLKVALDAQGRLDAATVTALSAPRQANLLRCWIANRGLSTPGSAHVDRLRHDLLQGRRDAVPCVQWNDVQVRRYRDQLYAMTEPTGIKRAYRGRLAPGVRLQLPGDLGTLAGVAATGSGLALRYAGQDLEVRFRTGGERIRPLGSEHTRELRTLLQERGIVPWMRDRIPFLYRGDELIAVADLWLARAFAAAPGEPGVCIVWGDHPPLY